MSPKELKKLQDLWERKLAKEGLADLEDDQGRLKRWHSNLFYHLGQDNVFKAAGSRNQAKSTAGNSENTNYKFFEAKQEYYYLATHFLEHYPFESNLERSFWQLLCEGKSNREIEKLLKIKRKKLGEIRNSLEQALLQWKR